METKNLGAFVAGAAAGALLMYYLDTANGRRRRAMVRDKVVAAGHDVADLAERNARRMVDQARGVMATGHLDRMSRTPPESDHQLHERIRARLGRLVSHPGAVHVEVSDGGRVRLEGHILQQELAALLQQLQDMPGVTALQNELQAHESPEHIPALQGHNERTPA